MTPLRSHTKETREKAPATAQPFSVAFLASAALMGWVWGCSAGKTSSRSPHAAPAAPSVQPSVGTQDADTASRDTSTGDTAAPSTPVKTTLEGSPLDVAPLAVDTAVLAPRVLRILTATRPSFTQGVDAQSSLSCSLAEGTRVEVTSELPADASTAESVVLSFVAPAGCPLTRGTFLRSHWSGF